MGSSFLEEHAEIVKESVLLYEIRKPLQKNNMKPYFFVLGAPDHEMQEIERVCKERGINHGYATVNCGNIVHTHEAYRATSVQRLVPPGSHVVMVECSVMGLPAHDAVDHHQPGDPGYGMPPERFFEGSSLGQFLTMLGLEPTQRQRVIAAADHCLTAAYKGLCPGVTPDELRAFREETRSRARNVSREELARQIEEAMKALTCAPRIRLADTDVAWFEEMDTAPAEVSEASARMGMPYVYLSRQDDGRVKAGIRSAPADVVRVWLDHCGLSSTYGDPQRGFAGGYFAS